MGENSKQLSLKSLQDQINELDQKLGELKSNNKSKDYEFYKESYERLNGLNESFGFAEAGSLLDIPDVYLKTLLAYIENLKFNIVKDTMKMTDDIKHICVRNGAMASLNLISQDIQSGVKGKVNVSSITGESIENRKNNSKELAKGKK